MALMEWSEAQCFWRCFFVKRATFRLKSTFGRVQRFFLRQHAGPIYFSAIRVVFIDD